MSNPEETVARCRQQAQTYMEIAELLQRQLIEHDPPSIRCSGCKYQNSEHETEQCSHCMRNYLDMFEQSVDEEDKWIIHMPEGTTNGEVILKLFPSARIKAQNDTVVTLENLDSYIPYGFFRNWWNAPYKGGNTDVKS